MFNIKNNLFCSNCGKTNHKYNNCNEPITSYGLICYYKNKIVLVRRKFTFSFIDFLMGKYNIENVSYLIKLFSRMTRAEIKYIVENMDFNVLRNIIGLNNYTKYHKNEYENSKVKFLYINNMNIIEEIIICIDYIFNENFYLLLSECQNYKCIYNKQKKEIIDKNNINDLKKNIINKKIYAEPEWEIPKGKRKDKECNLDTSIREFIEESNISNVIVYQNIIPLEERVTTINNNIYKNIYYLSELSNLYEINNISLNDDEILIPVDKNNKEQSKEISKVGIISISLIDKYLRDYQIEKKKVIYKSYQIFNNYKNYFS